MAATRQFVRPGDVLPGQLTSPTGGSHAETPVFDALLEAQPNIRRINTISCQYHDKLHRLEDFIAYYKALKEALREISTTKEDRVSVIARLQEHIVAGKMQIQALLSATQGTEAVTPEAEDQIARMVENAAFEKAAFSRLEETINALGSVSTQSHEAAAKAAFKAAPKLLSTLENVLASPLAARRDAERAGAAKAAT